MSTSPRVPPLPVVDPAIAAAVRAMAAWAAAARYDDLPEPVRHRAALVLVDDLAAMAAGRDDPELAHLHASMLAASGAAEASVFTGHGARADRYTAAAANGAAGTWCELDEGYRGTFCHAGVYVLPALLAEAEATDRPARDVVRCLAVAYEIVTRVARAFPGATRRLHPHGCFAAIGAAAAVALLRGYSARDLAATLDTAACMVNPTPFDHAFRGAMVRNVWAALGAANGLRAADWAVLGVAGLDTAPARVYAETFGGTPAPEAFTDRLGEDWAILFNFQRVHACCHFGHSTIEATQDLLRDVPDGHAPEDIERIVVEIHPLGLHLDDAAPTTTLGARFSMPHITAAATVLGHADVDAFSLARIADPRIAALRERVVLAPFEPTPQPPADRPARITWRFADGSERQAECADARGEPGHPFTERDILDKVETLAGEPYPGLPAIAEGLLAGHGDLLGAGWRSVVTRFAAPRAARD